MREISTKELNLNTQELFKESIESTCKDFLNAIYNLYVSLNRPKNKLKFNKVDFSSNLYNLTFIVEPYSSSGLVYLQIIPNDFTLDTSFNSYIKLDFRVRNVHSDSLTLASLITNILMERRKQLNLPIYFDSHKEI